jgi:hypothetical protein
MVMILMADKSITTQRLYYQRQNEVAEEINEATTTT